MIYLTMVIFLQAGKEALFNEFEAFAIPLMSDYSGQVIYRIRPSEESLIVCQGPPPYELHFISFDSENDFHNFLKDKRRKAFMHLKEGSIKTTFLVKGKEI